MIPLIIALPSIACRGVLGIEPLPQSAPEQSVSGNEPLGPSDSDAGEHFCSSVPEAAFCADFDDDADVLQGWRVSPGDPPTLGKATIGSDESLFRSAPRSAQMRVPNLLTHGTTGKACLEKFFVNESFRRLLFSFEMRIETEEFPEKSSGAVPLALLSFGPTEAAMLVRHAGGTGFATQGEDPSANKQISLKDSFPVGAWRHVEMLFDRDGNDGAGSITAGIDSATPKELPAPPGFATKDFAIFVGACGAFGPMGEFVVRVDNVAVYMR